MVMRSAVAGVHSIACDLQLCVYKALHFFQVMHASGGVWNHYCSCKFVAFSRGYRHCCCNILLTDESLLALMSRALPSLSLYF